MKEIELTNTKNRAYVDDEDFDRISSYKWRIHSPRTNYVVSTPSQSKTLYLHRVVVEGALNNGEGIVTHLNGNRLDNRKENLSINGKPVSVLDSRKPSPVKKTFKETVKSLPSVSFSWQELPIWSLKLDYAYQRVPSPTKIKKMMERANGWNDIAANTILVHKRANGDYYVLDGGHRIELAKQAKRDKIWATVWEGDINEAEVFLICQTMRKHPSVIEVYKASLANKDKESLAIKSILDKHGLSVAKHPKGSGGAVNVISCIGAIQKIFRKEKDGESVVDKVIGIIRMAYPKEYVSEAVFLGLAYFWIKYGGNLTEKDVADRLSRYELMTLIYEGKRRVHADGGKLAEQMVEIFRNAFNKGLKTQNRI